MVTPQGLFNLGDRFAWVEERIEGSFEVDTFQEIAQLFDMLRAVQHIPGGDDIWEDLLSYRTFLAGKGEEKFPAWMRPPPVQQLHFAKGRIQEALVDTIILLPDGNIRPKKLTEGVKAFMQEDVDTLSPDLEQVAFNEACKCLLAGAYTASEFSSLRVAESLLLRWYQRKRRKKLDSTWGAVLQALVALYPSQPRRPKELKLLDYLNERRIEVAHPKRVSRLKDAEATLLTIVMLVSDLRPMISPAKL